MNIPTIDGLTQTEQEYFAALVSAWSRNLAENIEKRTHYEGKVDVKTLDLGISVPPPMLDKLRRQSVMWVRKAVNAIGDCSVFDGYSFDGDEVPHRFDEVVETNNLVGLYDEAKVSELIHCAAFWTVTPGDKDKGEAPVVVNAYDAEHASALWDYRHRRILAGLAVTDVDIEHPDIPTAVNLYTSKATIECRKGDEGWTATRRANNTGRPLMEPMRFESMLGKKLGRSLITPAMMEIENNACREVVKMIMHSELYTAPSRWVMGAPDDIFENGRWQAYLGSIFALPRDENGDAPSTGSYPVGDMQPHIALMRQYANMFAEESSIPVHSLLYTEANPSSEGAIKASESDLVKRAENMNRRNGEAMRNIALLACSLLTETPFSKLDAQALSAKPRWKPASHPSISTTADAWSKMAAYAPSLPQTRVFWEQQGLDETTVDRIMDGMSRAGGNQTLMEILGGANG